MVSKMNQKSVEFCGCLASIDPIRSTFLQHIIRLQGLLGAKQLAWSLGVFDTRFCLVFEECSFLLS
jgi:hypothetical protein